MKQSFILNARIERGLAKFTCITSVVVFFSFLSKKWIYLWLNFMCICLLKVLLWQKTKNFASLYQKWAYIIFHCCSYHSFLFFLFAIIRSLVVSRDRFSVGPFKMCALCFIHYVCTTIPFMYSILTYTRQFAPGYQTTMQNLFLFTLACNEYIHWMASILHVLISNREIFFAFICVSIYKTSNSKQLHGIQASVSVSVCMLKRY